VKRSLTNKVIAEKLCAALWNTRRARLYWATVHRRDRGYGRDLVVLFDGYAPYRRFEALSELEVRKAVERETRSILRNLRRLGFLAPASSRPKKETASP
jgi:hypothetical protein